MQLKVTLCWQTMFHYVANLSDYTVSHLSLGGFLPDLNLWPSLICDLGSQEAHPHGHKFIPENALLLPKCCLLWWVVDVLANYVSLANLRNYTVTENSQT